MDLSTSKTGNAMADAAARGEGDELGRDGKPHPWMVAARLTRDLDRTGCNSDVIRELIEDEVYAQHLLDFALEVALAERACDRGEGDATVAANAKTAFNRWLRSQIDRIAGVNL